jgi:DNA polymerase (family 10)
MNPEVARLFREMADLLEIAQESPFRVRAYRRAARTVEALTEPVDRLLAGEAPARLPGIGEDLAEKIREIAARGTFAALEEARRAAPPGAAELLQVPGIGPKRAALLATRLGVRSLAGLARAARAHKVRELPGFGAAVERRILEAVEAERTAEHRVPRPLAAPWGEALVAHLSALDGVTHCVLAGSFRRARETVGDLDLLVTCRPGTPVIARFVRAPGVTEVLAQGDTRATVRLTGGLQVDLRVLDDAAFGAGLHYFTGSTAHNIAIRALAQARGLKLNEYGLFRGARRVGGRTEEEVFAAVGLPWIPPELREDRGEIAAAREGRLPALVARDDIRGDLQMHSTDSDGSASFEAMAEAAAALGYEYIAITDHSPAVRVAGGMDAAGFRAQRRRIDRFNARGGPVHVLAGAEVDIRADGTLDLDDDTLAMLDVVVVSLHTQLGLDRRAQTRRVVRALRHPLVDVFGHPTGRRLGARRGADLDWDAVFAAAADHGVLLEVNAQPERLDLDDVTARAAIAHGLRLVISTDAHAPRDLAFMRWGVDQARRAWATRADVANTMPLARLRKLLHGGR